MWSNVMSKGDAIRYDMLISGKEYRVLWISGTYSDKYNIYSDDIVKAYKKEIAFVESNLEIVKTKSSLGITVYNIPVDISYTFISLTEIKEEAPVNIKCTCDMVVLLREGCKCTAFQKGDR